MQECWMCAWLSISLNSTAPELTTQKLHANLLTTFWFSGSSVLMLTIMLMMIREALLLTPVDLITASHSVLEIIRKGFWCFLLSFHWKISDMDKWSCTYLFDCINWISLNKIVYFVIWMWSFLSHGNSLISNIWRIFN